jgi:hypothetical protein
MVAECQKMYSEVHPQASSPTANLPLAGPGSSVPTE